MVVTEPDGLPLDEACVLGHAEPARRDTGLLCRRHYGWIINMLREIEELWALRGLVLLPGPGSDVKVHTSRDGSPAPGRVAVMALSDARINAHELPMTYERNYDHRGGLESNGDDVPDVPGVLLGWWRILEEELPIRNPPDRLTVVELLHTLIGERRWIAQQPWVDDYATELHDLHRALAAATGAGMWAQPVGKCPNCQTRLYPTIGVDEVTCRKCSSTWRGVHLARLRLIFEQERQRELEQKAAAKMTGEAGT